MKIATITPCLYPDRSRIHFLEESCRRQGIELLPHGLGQQFYGWSRMFVEHTVPHIESLKREYTHVLHVDGSDVVIIWPIVNIMARYMGYGCPQVLWGAESNLFPDLGDMAAAKFKDEGPWRYLNAGVFIAEIDPFLKIVQRLKEKYADEGNTQAWFVGEWPQPGWRIDSECRVFQILDRTELLAVGKGMVFNKVWETYPCVLHFCGGYSDPRTGRDERIRPFIELLYGGENAREST